MILSFSLLDNPEELKKVNARQESGKDFASDMKILGARTTTKAIKVDMYG